MSVNTYDFPSAQPYDQYIAEKWFLRPSRHIQTDGSLNLEAETLAQLELLAADGDPAAYREGDATQRARSRRSMPTTSAGWYARCTVVNIWMKSMLR